MNTEVTTLAPQTRRMPGWTWLTGESWGTLDNRMVPAVESDDAGRRRGGAMRRVLVLAVVLTATVATGQWLDTITRLPYELHWSDNAEFGTSFRAQRFTPPRVWVESILLPDTVDTMTTVIPIALICYDSCAYGWTWFTVLDPGQRRVYAESVEITLPGGRNTSVAFPGVRFTTLGTHVARCSAYCYGHIPDTAAVREFEVVPYQIGTEEPGWPSAQCTWSCATMVRGVLRVRETEMTNDQCPMTLLDITGRKVIDLAPGENDVSRIAPGVYFVFRASGVEREASSVHKVVIQN